MPDQARPGVAAARAVVCLTDTDAASRGGGGGRCGGVLAVDLEQDVERQATK